ncbi:MAG TPA: response regulator [Thermoanaerobaculia bacterium]|nr:response regulator [Thermoanaerobaculia bacterium]
MATLEQRVLIADADSELRRQLYTRLLDADVYSDTVGDGQAAAEKLEERRYAVIVLDLGLPRVDGFQLLERLRTRPQEEWPIVLALVGRGPMPDLDGDLVQIAIRKPINTVQLADMIESCVRIAERREAILPRPKKKAVKADQPPAG